MEASPSYYDSQLAAIQKLYQQLSQGSGHPVSVSDAIISWFAEGHAEKFRDEYLKNQPAVLQ